MDEVSTGVVIVGAGPTGLTLAGELASRGMPVIVVDHAAGPDETPKGNGVMGHAAVRLRQLGLLEGTGLRVLRPPRVGFGPLQLRLGFGPRNPLHILPVPQRRVEQLLRDRAVAHGARIVHDREVTSFHQSGEAATVRFQGPGGAERSECAFLVGCDGAQSTVRKQAGIGYPGFTSDVITRIARVTIPADKVVRTRNTVELHGVGRFTAFSPNRTPGGVFSRAPAAALDRTAPRDVHVVAAVEPRGQAVPDDALPVAELAATLERVLGAALPLTTATAVRQTVGNSRQADAYLQGRVLLAGDAAHIFNAGGSSINAGLLDALDPAPRLASALAGAAPASSLDRYEESRRPACDRALAHTRLRAALGRNDAHGEALRTVLTPVLRNRAAARALARLMEAAPQEPPPRTQTRTTHAR